MNVNIKKFGVEMELKNNGIELDVRKPSTDEHLGDLIINKKGLIWCQGKIKAENGQGKTWEQVIEFFNS
jgi:hypothetical protein